MGLESFTSEKVMAYLEVLSYKNLAKVLMAMDELDRACSSTDIANHLAGHRLRVGNSSMAQTLKKGQELRLIKKNDSYFLTALGKEWASKARSVLQAIANLET